MTFVLAKILGFCSGKPPLEPGIGKNPGLLHRSSLSKATESRDSCHKVRFSGQKLQESAFLDTASGPTPAPSTQGRLTRPLTTPKREPPRPLAPGKGARLFAKAPGWRKCAYDGDGAGGDGAGGGGAGTVKERQTQKGRCPEGFGRRPEGKGGASVEGGRPRKAAREGRPAP